MSGLLCLAVAILGFAGVVVIELDDVGMRFNSRALWAGVDYTSLTHCPYCGADVERSADTTNSPMKSVASDEIGNGMSLDAAAGMWASAHCAVGTRARFLATTRAARRRRA